MKLRDFLTPIALFLYFLSTVMLQARCIFWCDEFAEATGELYTLNIGAHCTCPELWWTFLGVILVAYIPVWCANWGAMKPARSLGFKFYNYTTIFIPVKPEKKNAVDLPVSLKILM